jgi:hypothetical protein
LDIIAHGLSTAAAAATAQRASSQRIRLGMAAFFGMFPDLVSFTIPACCRIWWRLSGASPTLLPQADGPRFEWVWTVYNGSHSLLAFTVFFTVLWLLMRRPVLEALGWMLHILFDIFTHRETFAIQFLWPASSFHVDGIRWETPWLLAATYATLVVVSLLLWGGELARRLSAARPRSRG